MANMLQRVLQAFFFVFSLLILSVHSWENKVIVDQKLNVTNDCIQDSNNTLKCATINSALRNLKSDSTVIYIRPGNYTLRNGEETDITGKQDIAIIGSGEDTIITCTEYNGLGVLYSVNVRIEYIVMKGCGKKWRINIELDSDDFEEHSFIINVQVGLYLKEYDNITLCSMVLLDSKGAALYLGRNEYSSKSNFTMDSCKILNGSVSQNSISGGIVIDAYDSGTINLSNTSIINNGGGTQSHDVYCSPISAVAGIVVIESPAELIIDSCVITNNTRGFVVYDNSGSIRISNTSLFNLDIDSVVVHDDYWSPNAWISLRGVTIHNFTIIAPISFPPLIWHSSQDSNSASNEFLNISVGHECNYSLKLVEKDLRKCYSQPGICSNNPVQNYSGHCPPSYSQCVGNYCPCSEGRNGILCGHCADKYSVAINSPYMSCIPCDSSTVYRGWALLIVLEFIPITVMVAIIAVLNVNLNQGSLSGYIFFCQMITILFLQSVIPLGLYLQLRYLIVRLLSSPCYL